MYDTTLELFLTASRITLLLLQYITQPCMITMCMSVTGRRWGYNWTLSTSGVQCWAIEQSTCRCYRNLSKRTMDF